MIVDWKTLGGANQQDRLTDFSFAGYHNCNAPLPGANTAKPSLVLKPSNDGRDQSEEIQRAINSLSGNTSSNNDGQGGTIYFEPGTFILDNNRPIVIEGSHIRLQGHNTQFLIRGPARNVLVVGDANIQKPQVNGRVKVVDAYTPAGSNVLRVEKPGMFSPGQEILVERLASEDFIRANNMDRLERNGQAQQWLKPGTRLGECRRIVNIQDNAIVLDVPLTDSLNAQLGQTPTIAHHNWPQDAVSEVGICNIAFILETPQCGLPINTKPFFIGLIIHPYVQDVYVTGCYFRGFISSINIGNMARKLTIQDTVIERNAPTNKSAGYPADINISGSQVLVLRCSVVAPPEAVSFAVAIGGRVSGPNAIVGCKAPSSHLQPHARWSTGTLFDGCDVDRIDIMNRSTMGSGHGWSGAMSVAWNCRAASRMTVQKPPTSQNFAVGCISKNYRDVNDALVISKNQHVDPLGLFACQLKERVGPQLAEAILGMRV